MTARFSPPAGTRLQLIRRVVRRLRISAVCACLYSFIGLNGAFPQGAAAHRDGSQPSLERICSYVFDLADDTMMGRMAASAGYDKAARYTVDALHRFGVAPAFSEGGESVSGYSHQFTFSLDEGGADDFRSYNIVGLVNGTDPDLRSQLVVVSAHLDHIGTHEGEVYNGASDNASGVAVVLEVARLLAEHPLRRTVLFAFFGAEELGLKGSEAFVELMSGEGTRIIVDVNVDEVGHLSGGPVGRPLIRVLSGARVCPALVNVVRDAGDAHGLAVSDLDPNEFFEHSDHYSFHEAAVPVLFFTGGWDHRWLHAPDDEADWVNYDHLRRLTSVVFETVLTLGNDTSLCAFMM